jgi:hypothetical protein
MKGHIHRVQGDHKQEDRDPQVDQGERRDLVEEDLRKSDHEAGHSDRDHDHDHEEANRDRDHDHGGRKEEESDSYRILLLAHKECEHPL